MNYFEHQQYSATPLNNHIWHIHDATKNNPVGLHGDGTFVNTSSIYVIEDKTQILVVDLGNPYQDNHLREMVDMIAKGRTIKVAITHNHFDHIGAIQSFNDCEIYFSKKDPINDLNQPITIKENDIIELDTLSFKVMEVPAHTPGSIAFLEEKQGFLFC